MAIDIRGTLRKAGPVDKGMMKIRSLILLMAMLTPALAGLTVWSILLPDLQAPVSS